LGALVARILKLVPDLPMLRLSSLDAIEMDDQLFELVTQSDRVAPYLHLSRPMEALLVFGPIAALGARYVSGGGKRSVHDPEAARRIIAYRASTPRLLYELTRITRHAYALLPRVRQPVLVLQSREDNRIPQRSAQRAFDAIGSTDKTLEWLTGTGHVITVDYGHEAMERRVGEWLETRLA
jgi:pimeloyl-ACP methyl ester carboxylesterase